MSLAFYFLLKTLLASAQCPDMRWGLHSSDPDAHSISLWATFSEKTHARFVIEGPNGALQSSAWHSASLNTPLVERVEGLQPETQYRYRVEAQGCPKQPDMTGQFQTLPLESSLKPIHFQWSADLGGQQHCRKKEGGYPIFKSMLRDKAEFFLFIGDTIYADHGCPETSGNIPSTIDKATTEKEFFAKYLYQFEDEAFRNFLLATPVMATWDDHEVRDDFSGPTDPLTKAGLGAFLLAYPMAPIEKSQQIYRKKDLGSIADLFILDTRLYRSPDLMKDGPNKTMLGKKQLAWLLDGLARSSAKWKIIASSVPFSAPTGYPGEKMGRDGWSNFFDQATLQKLGEFPGKDTGFEHELSQLMALIHTQKIHGVVVLTADIHQAMAIAYDGDPIIHELISGPLSAGPGPILELDPTFKPRKLFEKTGINNYGRVTLSEKELSVEWVSETGEVFHTMAISAGI